MLPAIEIIYFDYFIFHCLVNLIKLKPSIFFFVANSIIFTTPYEKTIYKTSLEPYLRQCTRRHQLLIFDFLYR
jgi:hypothetical protein